MGGIWNLALATGAFVGTHLILSHPLRPWLAGRLGEARFLGLYSLVGLATFGWLIWARLETPSMPSLWLAGPGLWDLATILMLLAAILLAGSLVGNPAAPDPTGNMKPIGAARGVYAITRHPMMWSFILWAVIHILLWGSAANLIVSGGVLLLAVIGSIGQDAKKLRLQGDRWRDWMNRTACIPFAGQVSGRISWSAAWPGWGTLIAGIVIWLAAAWAHAPLGGPVSGIWRWIG